MDSRYGFIVMSISMRGENFMIHVDYSTIEDHNQHSVN